MPGMPTFSREELDSTGSLNKRGMLAPSAADFADSKNISKLDQDPKFPPYSVTNRGIQITLPIIPPDASSIMPYIPSMDYNQDSVGGIRFTIAPTSTLALLNCTASRSDNSRIGICLDRSHPMQPYHRTDHSLGLLSIPVGRIEDFDLETIIVRASDSRDGEPL